MREKDEEYQRKVRAYLNRRLIEASEKNNLKFIGRLLEEGQFNPDKQTLTRAIQRAMEMEHDVIAVFLLNYCSKHNHRKLEVQIDFKVNNESPLLYAVAKNNAILVEALLNSGAAPIPKETEYFLVDSFHATQHSNLMLMVLKNLNHANSKKILFLLLSNGADFSNVPISRIKITLYCYLSIEESALAELTDDTQLIELLLEQLKKKHPAKFESLCINIIKDNRIFIKYPLLFKKILSVCTPQILAQLEDSIRNRLVFGNLQVYKKLDQYIFTLMAYGLRLDLCSIVKEREEMREFNKNSLDDMLLSDEDTSDKEDERKRLDDLLATPSLTPNDYALPPELLAKKLKQIFIPQEDLNRAANHFLMRRIDKFCLFVAAGAKPSLIQADIARFQITDRNRLELELFRHVAKSNNVKMLQLMLDAGLRFRDTKALTLLREINDEAKAKNNTTLVHLLTPVLLKEQKLIHAKSEGIIQQRREGWLEHQIKLRPKMLQAISGGNLDAIIALVGEGANPNFTGDGIQDDWIVSHSCALNVRGVSPLHFACMHPNEETAITMFQTLCDLGASLKIADEWTQRTWGTNLATLYQTSQHHILYQNILKTSFREAGERVKAPLTDKVRASSRQTISEAPLSDRAVLNTNL